MSAVLVFQINAVFGVIGAVYAGVDRVLEKKGGRCENEAVAA